MPSIRSLVDTFGQPPPEVTLDWIWQLRSASYSTGQSGMLEDKAAEQRTIVASSDWQSLVVDPDGVIALEQISDEVAAQAIDGLQKWLQVEGYDHSIEGNTGLANKSNRWQQQSKHETPHDLSAASSHGSSMISERSIDRRTGRRARTRWLFGVVGGAALVAATLFIAITQSSNRSLQPSASSRSAALAASDSGSPDLKQRSDQGVSPVGRSEPSSPVGNRANGSGDTSSASADAAALTTFAEVALLPTTKEVGLDMVAAEVRSGESSSSDTPSAAGGIADLQLKPTLTAAVDVSRPADQSPQSHADTTHAPSPAGDLERSPAAIDLMDTIQQTMQLAERQSEADANAASIQEPGRNASSETLDPQWLFARDVLTRKVAMPGVPNGQPRATSWTVRLEASREFLLEPQEDQTVEAKQSAQWSVFDQAAKSPRVGLIIKVWQRNPREQSLRCISFASAEDLPQLSLPLDRKFLDPLRARVQAASATFNGLVESAANAGSGVSREQRQWLKQQLKLAERLSEIIADADRLASLLDGEIKLGIVRSPTSSTH